MSFAILKRLKKYLFRLALMFTIVPETNNVTELPQISGKGSQILRISKTALNWNGLSVLNNLNVLRRRYFQALRYYINLKKTNRVFQRKVYDRVCSLNQLINWIFLLFSLSHLLCRHFFLTNIF